MSKRQRKIEEINYDRPVPVRTSAEWLTESNGEILELKLSDGLLLLLQVENAEEEGLAAQAAVIMLADWERFSQDLPKFRDWVASAQASFPNGATFRLFGAASFLPEVETTLESFDLKAGKHLSLPHDSTVHFIPREGRIRIEKKALLSLSLRKETTAKGETIVAEYVENSQARKVRVLVVDDSATIRKLLKQIISEDPDCECVGAIGNPSDVEQAIEDLKPNVVTLDIHMPEIDGLTLLRQIFPKYRIPVLMISSLGIDEGRSVLDALASGAVDYVQKPSRSSEFGPSIIEKIKTAASAQPQTSEHKDVKPKPIPRVSGDCDLSYLVALGASTGGTEAIRKVLEALPEVVPPILIVQHIPAGFSRAFAERMDLLCPFTVKEAKDGELVLPSRVYIAPGGTQMRIREVDGERRIVVDDSEPVNRHKPSVDFLFDSVAQLNHSKVIGVLLTGMGADGARGLLKLKQGGATTIAQDAATSVVFGMPKEAINLGAADKVLGISHIGEAIVKACAKRRN
jgi:two-component system, chemotaxis family, protein-glutamate methylesterase/glutaminase